MSRSLDKYGSTVHISARIKHPTLVLEAESAQFHTTEGLVRLLQLLDRDTTIAFRLGVKLTTFYSFYQLMTDF